MTETGVIHGRFQVLHNDHMKYLLAGKARCRHLIVAITNPDPCLTKDDPADTGRSLSSANPLTYFERYTILRSALQEEGISEAEYSLVPLPINLPELYRYYVPLDAVFYLTIYDDWGRRKLEMFKSLGLTTEVLWERSPEEKGLTGSEIRGRMMRGAPWEHLVPRGAAQLMELWAIPERLRKLAGSDPSTMPR